MSTSKNTTKPKPNTPWPFLPAHKEVYIVVTTNGYVLTLDEAGSHEWIKSSWIKCPMTTPLAVFANQQEVKAILAELQKPPAKTDGEFPYLVLQVTAGFTAVKTDLAQLSARERALAKLTPVERKLLGL